MKDIGLCIGECIHKTKFMSLFIIKTSCKISQMPNTSFPSINCQNITESCVFKHLDKVAVS